MGKSNTKIIIAIAAAAIIAGGSVFAFMSNSAKPQNNPQDTKEILARLTTPSIPNANALGSDAANITIVEFGDYQCTWCMRFHKETRDSIMTNYVDTGSVKFLFKDFPINDLADKASSTAAEASYCAADQGKYWEYHNELYHNWDGENTGWITKDSLRQFASNVEMPDQAEFNSCLDSGKYSKTVRDNYILARDVGLKATPSFIVIPASGEPILLEGAYPYDTFKKVIEDYS
ncbi:MAG: disulfide bond formation protein DsbA [Nitrososphaera sp.]|nr:disulfide bond formation protein DsbA [Nitrososphaera sp.]